MKNQVVKVWKMCKKSASIDLESNILFDAEKLKKAYEENREKIEKSDCIVIKTKIDDEFYRNKSLKKIMNNNILDVQEKIVNDFGYDKGKIKWSIENIKDSKEKLMVFNFERTNVDEIVFADLEDIKIDSKETYRKIVNILLKYEPYYSIGIKLKYDEKENIDDENTYIGLNRFILIEDLCSDLKMSEYKIKIIVTEEDNTKFLLVEFIK